MRRGITLVELVVVLAVLGILSAFAVLRFRGVMDRRAVARAASDVASFYGRARLAAIFRSATVRVAFREDTLTATLEAGTEEVEIAQPGPAHHGVSLHATREIIRLYPNGIGMGGANTMLILTRGMAAETLTTSRLGRLKRW